jgi:hypothetical protein
MSTLHFSLRLAASYRDDSNEIRSLEVEHVVDGEWQPLELGLASPGFDIFMYAILTCQHMYFRVNCAERGLLLDSATAGLRIASGDDRKIESLAVSFAGKLRQGKPGAGDIEYIRTRMQQCPVSINLGSGIDSSTVVELGD